jgi:hypothetical protein
VAQSKSRSFPGVAAGWVWKLQGHGGVKTAALTCPDGLISLLDMLWAYGTLFMSTMNGLQGIRYTLISSPDKALTGEDRQRLKEMLKFLSDCSGLVDLDATKHLAEDLLQDILLQDVHARLINGDELDAKIDSIQSMASQELADRKFLYVPKARAGHYGNKLLCGELVAEKFPAALPDIIEAGNCFALERPTACVFHLMRVIPYGMAALAKLLKVKYTQPIRCLQWNEIIQPIDNAVKGLQKVKRSPQKLRDQQYYSEIVVHLYFCKDAWRNHVSHSPDPYDMGQALSVMDHVSLVMSLVSKRVKRPFSALR